MQLSQRAMLAKLRISRYTPSATDREVTENVATRNHADVKRAGRYTKVLIASQFLTGINSALDAASTAHKFNTLPWDDDGTRILTARRHQQYVDVMRACRHRTEAQVDTFCTPEVLAEVKAEAKGRLGKMYRDEDYPDLAKIKASFGLKVEIWGLPETSDFRAALSNDQVKVIQKDQQRLIDSRIEGAVKSIYERAHVVVKRMVEIMKDQDKTVRHAVIVNVREVAEIMGDLNLTDDPKIEKLRQQMLDELTQHHPTELSEDANIRSRVGNKADALLRRISDVLA